jgi:hypothetical protein
MSEETNAAAALNKALARVQKAVLSAAKDGKNPHFGSKYATLAEVLATVRDPLADNGFALIQDADTDLDDGTVGVVTRLIHESGVELASKRLSAPMRKEYTKAGTEIPPSVQQIGALVTYLRRYSLCAFLSVAVEDDDGNAASDAGKCAPAPAPAPATKPANNRVSAHTGEKLNTPDAVARHQQAAQQATPQSPRASVPAAAPAAAPPPAAAKPAAAPAASPPAPPPVGESMPWPRNPDLVAAMKTSGIHPWMLDGYLRGLYGQPKIKRPILLEGMTLDMIGGATVESLLKRENWEMVVGRINADDPTPF